MAGLCQKCQYVSRVRRSKGASRAGRTTHGRELPEWEASGRGRQRVRRVVAGRPPAGAAAGLPSGRGAASGRRPVGRGVYRAAGARPDFAGVERCSAGFCRIVPDRAGSWPDRQSPAVGRPWAGWARQREVGLPAGRLRGNDGGRVGRHLRRRGARGSFGAHGHGGAPGGVARGAAGHRRVMDACDARRSSGSTSGSATTAWMRGSTVPWSLARRRSA